MAQVPLCDSDDGNRADVIITKFDNGDTFAACTPCLLGWCAGMLAAFDADAPPVEGVEPATPGDPAVPTVATGPGGVDAPPAAVPESQGEGDFPPLSAADVEPKSDEAPAAEVKPIRGRRSSA